MHNGRFSIATHILTLLARFQDDWLSSEFISGSINIHPVVVRKELTHLRKAGLVISKEGKNGGSRLARPAEQILLSEVYHTIRQTDILGRKQNEPNPKCPVGSQINQHLDTLYQAAELALVQELERTTLAEFSKKFD